MKMCAALARSGHAVSLLTPRRPERLTDVADVFDYYGVPRLFTIDSLPWIGIKGKAYLFAWLAARHARAIGADLVYGRAVHACYFATVLGLPAIFESHAPITEFDRIGSWMFARMIRSRRFRALVVISDALRRHYQQNYPALNERIVVAPDAADDVGAASAPPAAADANAQLQVGYAGHLYKGKGMDLIAQLAPHCPWARFHIIGGMPEHVAEWRARCADTPNIEFHGFCAPALVHERLLHMDVALAPYQRSVAPSGGRRDIARWMSPLKIFEYMAAGRAMIASDLPVLREVLNESNALLVDPEDVEAWVAALAALRDPQRRQQLGTQAYSDFLRAYTWQARAARVLA